MKRWNHFLLLGMLVLGMWIITGIQAEAAVPVDAVHFPDETIRAYAESMDVDKNGVLSDIELQIPTYFSWHTKTSMEEFGAKPGAEVNFKGMEYFINIEVVSLGDMGVGGERWNCENCNLLDCFPYAKRMNLTTYGSDGVGEICLSGISNSIEDIYIYATRIKKWNVKAKNLKKLEMEVSGTLGKDFSLEGAPSLQELAIHGAQLQDTGISLKGLHSLKFLSLLRTNYRTLDLSPVKKTLKTLSLGDHHESDDVYNTEGGSRYLRTLDISQMEKLEEVWAGDMGITKLITRDAAGKAKTKRLKELYLSECKIKSIDVSAMPRLEKLHLRSTSISKLNVTKNKRLQELGISCTKIKSINLKKNVKLDTLIMGGMKRKIKTLDLSKNTSLRALYLGQTRIGTLRYPMLKKSMKWSDYYKSYSSGYGGGSGALSATVTVVDLSKITKLTKKTKGYQLKIERYSGVKKVIMSKKLKKADRKWMKRKIRQAGAKVVVK